MRLTLCALAVLMLVAVTGCSVVPLSPVIGAITIDQKGPVAVGDPTFQTGDKVGISKAEGILLVSWGDASIGAACAQAQIRKIHRVESQTLGVLGIYARYETHVYGE